VIAGLLTAGQASPYESLPLTFAQLLVSGVGTIGYSHVSQGGTAFFAHVGGFVAGMLLINVMGPRSKYLQRRDLNW